MWILLLLLLLGCGAEAGVLAVDGGGSALGGDAGSGAGTAGSAGTVSVDPPETGGSVDAAALDPTAGEWYCYENGSTEPGGMFCGCVKNLPTIPTTPPNVGACPAKPKSCCIQAQMVDTNLKPLAWRLYCSCWSDYTASDCEAAMLKGFPPENKPKQVLACPSD